MRKKRIIYKKQKCAFVGDNDKPCKNYAVGKSTLCAKHGGKKIVDEMLVSYHDMSALAMNKTKFNPAVHPVQFLQLSQSGKSVSECAAEMMVSSDTLRKWSETFKEFAYVFELGADLHEAYYLRMGKANLTNTRFQTGLFKWLTTNKLGYAEKTESSSTNQNTHVGVLLVPGQMSVEEWEKKNVEDEEALDAEYEEVKDGS